MASFAEMKIKALRMFSHFHLGTVSQGEVRIVTNETGKALIGMGLAEALEEEANEAPVSGNARKGGKGGNKPGATEPDKKASEG